MGRDDVHQDAAFRISIAKPAQGVRQEIKRESFGASDADTALLLRRVTADILFQCLGIGNRATGMPIQHLTGV